MAPNRSSQTSGNHLSTFLDHALEASIARDYISELDEGFGAEAAGGHVLVAQVPESIDIELVVREDHKVLKVLRVGAGVV